MIVFQVRFHLAPARRSRVIRSLRRILGQVRILQGCLNCHLFADVEDENYLLLIEEWADLQSLRVALQADSFRVVLSALDCACDQPEVRFDVVAESSGMELIRACRTCVGTDD